MPDDEVTYTDETCDNCGAGLIRVEPDDPPEFAEAAVICPPDQGCGSVDRYEDEDGEVVG